MEHGQRSLSLRRLAIPAVCVLLLAGLGACGSAAREKSDPGNPPAAAGATTTTPPPTTRPTTTTTTRPTTTTTRPATTTTPPPSPTTTASTATTTVPAAAIPPAVPAPGERIGYYGGLVENQARVHLIFWGPDWKSSGASLLAAETKFIAEIGAQPWARILLQYRDSAGPAGQNISFAGAWVDTSAIPQDLQENFTDAEVNQAALVNDWPLSNGNVFIIFPQPGVALANPGSCSYHSVGISPNNTLFPYAVMGSSGDLPAGCEAEGAGSAVNAIEYWTGHELAEMLTDPYLTAWGAFGPSPDGEDEIADLCVIQPGYLSPAGMLPYLFDKSTTSCTVGRGLSD